MEIKIPSGAGTTQHWGRLRFGIMMENSLIQTYLFWGRTSYKNHLQVELQSPSPGIIKSIYGNPQIQTPLHRAVL